MMAPASVLLRASSGPKIGMGHAMRTRAVAQWVEDVGGTVRVVVDDDVTAALLGGEGFDACSVDSAPDWTNSPCEAFWLDGFRNWSPELERLRRRGAFTVLVENRTPAREHCDRLIYPALHHEDDDWDRGHRGAVRSGPSWIPLSREITDIDREGCTKDVDLLVTFGGSDPRRLTDRVVCALQKVRSLEGKRVAVAVGPHMAERREELAALLAPIGGAKLLPTGTSLAPWVARSRAAVTALGTTLYELAYFGAPALILANYATDRPALDYYAIHGPHVSLGPADERTDDQLARDLEAGLARACARSTPLPGLGGGARSLAELLVWRADPAHVAA